MQLCYFFVKPLELRKIMVYAPVIIYSLHTGQPSVLNVNVQNTGLIDSLLDCVMEVPCVLDKNKVQPTQMGALPPQLLAELG